jgi:putative membrane protein
MVMWHGNWSGADWVLMSIAMLMFWAAVIAGTLWLIRATRARVGNRRDGVSLDKRDQPNAATASDILDSRYARGELSDDDYRARRDTLTTR